ncbi:MAG: pseudaminic acid synthase [Polyangiaceae bacterium]|nr:pseudaminic acid synthase [Polyangiaceae bacterium]
MRSFRIGDRAVGGDAPTYFIAELSANHGHDLDKALQTIEAAAKAGADAVKLQTYTPDTLTLRSGAPPFVVATKNEWAGRTLHDLYAEAMTPWEWHRQLIDAASALGMACFSTPFDETAVAFLDELGVPAYKIASFELVDLPLVERVARLHRPMILSTGMASLGEIVDAVATCHQAGNRDLAVLRCVSAYPASPASMALRSLEVLRGLDVVIGLSDHTTDPVAAITAVALGARVVEKHLIVDRAWGGPDAFFSLEPAEFAEMVRRVRVAEAAMGAPRFGPSAEERSSVAFRRSLFVAADVAEGELLTADNVRSVRPSHGLSPRHLPDVLGRRAARALSAAEPLAWDMVGARPAPAVTLRPVVADDTDRLLAWRNDEATRAMSRSQAPVSREEHVAWLDGLRDDARRRLFVAVHEGAPVGQVRLDDEGDGAWELSFTVAPDARGQGLATELLRAAEVRAKELGATTLLAEIRAENARSLRAFRAAGWYGFATRTRDGQAFVRAERRVAGFGG